MPPRPPSLGERLRGLFTADRPVAPRDVTAGPAGPGPAAGALPGLWRGVRGNILGDVALGMTPLGMAADIEDFGAAAQNRDALGMVLAGAGAVPVVGDVVKRGGKAVRNVAQATADLPMDQASRMARAREMGYTTPVYHGTSRTTPIEEFKPASQTGAYPHEFDVDAIHVGTKMQANERLADLFALGNRKSAVTQSARERNVPRGWTEGRLESANRAGFATEAKRPSVMPLLMKSEKPFINVAAARPFTEQELLTEIRRFGAERNIADPVQAQRAYKQFLLDEGYDTIPYINKLEGAGQVSHMVLKPENLRSQFARFDPAQAGSSNLMAGLAGILATGAGARAMTNRREEERP